MAIRNLSKGQAPGYLPLDYPGFARTVGLSLQLFIAIFPATVFVPLVTGFNVSAVLFMSGLGTLIALLVTRGKMPLYYGSSFSAILALQAIVVAAGGGETGIRVAQVGIAVAGLLEILIALVVWKGGQGWIEMILPPVVTGSVAITIAFGLSGAAIGMASGTCCLKDAAGAATASLRWWLVAGITCLVTAVWSFYIRGNNLFRMLPILGGAVVGYIVSLPLGLVSLQGWNQAALIRVPHLTLPAFTHPMALTSAVTVGVIIIAVIPEFVAHLLQINEVIAKIGRDVGKAPDDLSKLVHLVLASGGAADFVDGLGGGVLGTNYGEGIATMLLSNAATIFAVIGASIIAMLASTSGHLEVLIRSVPEPVIGGLSIYMFGAFGMVGFKMLMQVGADEILKPEKLGVAVIILILGLGGANAYGGALPMPLSGVWKTLFPGGLPAIAVAALCGILLNLLFQVVTPERLGLAKPAATPPADQP
jgi:uracil permease